MSSFLDHLKDVSAGPYAFIAYVVLVLLWAIVIVRTARLRTMSRSLQLVPEADRKALLEKEYGIHLKTGMSSAAFIKAQVHRYLFLGFLALVGAVSVVAIIALAQQTVPKSATQQFCDAIDVIARDIDFDFTNVREDGGTPNDDGSTTYESIVIIPGTSYNNIDVDSDGANFIATLYHGPDRAVAYDIYSAAQDKFRACKTDWLLHAGILDEKRKDIDYVSFVKGTKKVIISINPYEEDPSEIYVNVMFVKAPSARKADVAKE